MENTKGLVSNPVLQHPSSVLILYTIEGTKSALVPNTWTKRRGDTWETVCWGGLVRGLCWASLTTHCRVHDSLTSLVHLVGIVLCSSPFPPVLLFHRLSFVGAFIHNCRNFCWNRTWMFVTGDCFPRKVCSYSTSLLSTQCFVLELRGAGGV